MLAFIDTETTGLDRDNHEIWEVALILRSTSDDEPLAQDEEYLWQLPVNEGKADPIALKIGQYYERRWDDAPDAYDADADHVGGGILLSVGMPAYEVQSHPRLFASEFARLTFGAHIVGAVPSFDEERLAKFLRKHGACPGWHYHLIDVEALMVGALSPWNPHELALPWKSDELSKGIGINPDEYDKHTALSDARWARDVYDKIVNG